MKRGFFSRLRNDQRGAAAVEFALWSTAFFLVIMVAIDFGYYYVQRSKLNTAVGAAAISAYNNRDNVSFAQMTAYVRGVSGDDAATVTLACNGVVGACTNFSRTFACLKVDGSYIAATEGSTCTGGGMTGGSTAGYYFTIEASRPYEAMIIPDSVIDGSTMAQRATIRLE